MSLSLSLSFPRSSPSGNGLSSFLKKARLPQLLLAGPRSLRVGRFTVDVTSALARAPLLSNSRCLLSLLSRARSHRDDSLLYHFSLVACTLIRSVPLYSLVQLSRSTRDFYDSFRAAPRSIGTSSRRGLIDPLSSLGGCEGPTSQPPGHDKIVT